MSYKHQFHLYTVRIRQKFSSAHLPLDNFDGSSSSVYDTIYACMNAASSYIDIVDKKQISLKESCTSDNKNSAIYGFLRSGAYGLTGEIYHVVKKRKTKDVEAEEAQLLPFFYYFYLPKHNTTGALIVHSVGQHGMFGQLKHNIETYFKLKHPDYILDIESVFFNLTKSGKTFFESVEIDVYEPKSKTQKAVTGNSPRAKKLAKFIFKTPWGPDIIKQLLESENAKDFVIDQVNPFIQSKALKENVLEI